MQPQAQQQYKMRTSRYETPIYSTIQNTRFVYASFLSRIKKGITLEEGYLIGKALWIKDMKLKSAISNGKITVTSEDELQQIEVTSLKGYTVLSMFIAD